MFGNETLKKGLTAFAKAAAMPFYRRRLEKFERMLAEGHSVQRRTLFDKLRRCADSQFGKDHGFSKIRTIDDYRRAVPIAQYEYFAPYIKAVSEGKIEALFPSWEKVLAFGCTSGTSGDPKLNPVTTTWLREYRRSWETWGTKAILSHPDMIGTRILQLTGPGDLDRTPSGLSVGMVSAIAVRHQSRLLRSFYATPFEVSDISEAAAKYYTILRLSMVQDVGFLIAITPANLIRLAETGNEFRESLIRDIHDGTLRSDFQLPPGFREKVDSRIRVKRPDLARKFEQAIESTGKLYPKDYWRLHLVTCWLGGTIGYQSRILPQYYGQTAFRDLGLVSTEGRHTTPLEDNRPEGVLAVDGNYYEFIPVEEMGTPNPTVLECHELETGGEYFLIMTTSSGLYRYDIGDVVRCVGYMGQAPLLEFLHKDDSCVDMEGEKISGHQIAQAVETAAQELALKVGCVTAVPVRSDGDKPHYALLIEEAAFSDKASAVKFLQIVDRELVKHNVMYAGKRNDLYIDAPRLVRLRNGAWSDFVTDELNRRGTAESQYKHPSLVPDAKWLDRFEPVDTVRVS